jgi:hypothetical protein
MLNRLDHLRRDERGMSFVFVGVGFMAFMAATTLAIDVGMLMTARSQAQTSADSGALAGAVALAFNNATDRTSSGPAVQSAVNTARSTANQVMSAPVSVNPGDVTFPVDPVTGASTRVQVQVYRSSGRGNPVSTLIAGLFGTATANVGATAIAEAVPANAARCVKPWAFPDRWTERQTPPFDATDTFNAFPSSPTVSPDLYVGATSGSYTGYKSANVGTQIVLKPAVTGTIPAAGYYALDLPGGTAYGTDVEQCNDAKIAIGDTLSAQPSGVASATSTGVNDLIAMDPSAYYDTAARKVVSSLSPSPRIVTVPVYDPLFFDQGRQVGSPVMRVADFVGFFVETVNASGWITGRIVPVSGLTTGAAAGPISAFPRAVRLVQ